MGFKKKFDAKASYVGLRDPFLLGQSIGKKVLHIGCTDWPFAKTAFENETLLHSKLSQIASELIGLDIDEKGIDYLETLLPGCYIRGNLIHPVVRSEVLKNELEIIMVPDVIEHVPNQFDFIEGLLELQKSSNAQIIVTTPNTYSLKSFLAASVGLDYTHTDHRLFHNESTLRTSFEVDFNIDSSRISFEYCSREIKQRYGTFLSLVSRFLDLFFHFKPQLADTIVFSIQP